MTALRSSPTWLVASLAALGISSSSIGSGITITLPESGTTSAGIFDASSHLIRTLWSARAERSGPVRVNWDGRDDQAMPVAEGSYQVQILLQNVHYVWEGVIGNTSASFTGAIHRALGPIIDMAIDAEGHAFYVLGYNEQQSAIHGFNCRDPQRPVSLGHDDYRRVFEFTATDGTLVYFANIGLHARHGAFNREPSTFVMALHVADGTEYSFPQGAVDVPPGNPANRWNSVIDDDRSDADDDDDEGFRNAPSGLAVQQRGRALFVAHQSLDAVRVFDKRSGALLDTLSVPKPAWLAIAPDDSLWLVSRASGGSRVVHYRLSGAHWAAQQEFSAGLDRPTAIAVSPIDGTLLIADAATEQLKAFTGEGRLLWTLGEVNAYRDGHPEVSNERFWLSAAPTYIAFEADGSFWFGDPGNARNLHFSAGREYLEQIAFSPKSYHIAVDPADPQRVFDGYLEFAVNYTQPLRDSWHLVRNWAAGLRATGLDRIYLGDMDGFRSVYTLSNGRSYAVAPRYDGSRTTEIVELNSSGLRPTGARLEFGSKLYPDGSLKSEVVNGSSVEVQARTLSGFDQSGNPRWNDPVVVARIAKTAAADPYYHDVPPVGGVNEPTLPVSEDDVLVFFNPGRSAGYHLGGVRVGGSDWLWRASPSGRWNVDLSGGIVSPDGTYDVDHGVQYAGSVPMTSGHNILFGYYGEAWNGGQANQWLHFLDNGLYVGQFGQPDYPSTNRFFAHEQQAGNAFSPQLVKVDGHVYLWHNDESVHGGVHRWRIDGIDDIRIVQAPISR
jgi:hypothetical protein